MTEVAIRQGLYKTKSGLCAVVLEVSPEATHHLYGFVQLGPVVSNEPLPARRKMIWFASGVALRKSDSTEGLDLGERYE